MRPEDLLDAFGQIDDDFVAAENRPRALGLRRTLTALAAAVLIIALSVGTAMAFSEVFRAFVFSIFRIETMEQPPAPTETQPTEPGLYEIDVVNIDGQVKAWYFSGGGYVQLVEGGFYTSQWPENDMPPEDPAFWELRADGAVEVPSTRVDLPLEYGGRTFRICFDYATLRGRLSLRVWPQGLDEDPVGNGWNARPLSCDLVLLTVPILKDGYWCQDLLTLDLNTLGISAFITDTAENGVAADGYQLADDLRFAIVSGTDMATGSYGYWLYDRQIDAMTDLNTMTARNITDAWFLDENNLILREETDQGRINLLRWFMEEETMLLEHIRPRELRQIGSTYALLCRDGSTPELVVLWTGTAMELTGLDGKNLTMAESPDGRRIMLAHETAAGFTDLGILDWDTGELKLLDRAVSGGSESFRGWLDEDTLVIAAHDVPDADLNFTPGDAYCIYVYQFRAPDPNTPTESTDPAPTQMPAYDDFVRVADYIPDIAEDLRYATDNNFTGQTIYDFTEAWLRYGTVIKLMQVQEELRQDGMYLKIWDGFRPVSAQFRLWEVYPDARYVANPLTGFSSHSRGNTVDITLTYADGREVPMPTDYDDFSALADRNYSDCDPETAANARYLEAVMVKYGFKPYSAEWWHFTDTQSYPVEEVFQPTDQ